MKNFPQKTYNKRNRNENVNYVFKNKYGDALSAYTVAGRRAEIATKVLCHNLWARLNAFLDDLFKNALRFAKSLFPCLFCCLPNFFNKCLLNLCGKIATLKDGIIWIYHGDISGKLKERLAKGVRVL